MAARLMGFHGLPVWRNGRRKGLKIPWPITGRVGSSPTTGTARAGFRLHRDRGVIGSGGGVVVGPVRFAGVWLILRLLLQTRGIARYLGIR